MLAIQAADGSLHPISKEAALLADFLATQSELVQPDEPMGMHPDTPPEHVKWIIEFLEKAKDQEMVKIRRPLVGQGDLVASGCPPWALEWLQALFEGHEDTDAWDLVFALLDIGDFINCEVLMRVLTAKVASRICAMDEATKRIVFQPARELSEEEKAQIRAEHAWAEMDPPEEN